MLNNKDQVLAQQDLQTIVEVHKTEPTFSRRPLTTWLVEQTSSLSGMSIGWSFAVVGFALFYLSGIMLFHLSRKLGATSKQAAINMVVFFLCFSNLFAYFPPVYTYDDPLQYLLIFASLYLLVSRKWIPFLICITLAILARESTLFILPAFVLFFPDARFKETQIPFMQRLRYGLLYLVPVVLYFATMYMLLSSGNEQARSTENFSGRFDYLELNFSTSQFASESIISFYLVLGVPLLFLYHLTKEKLDSALNLQLTRSFFLTLIINSLVVILMTKAREARLFALPLVFIWPVFSQLFKEQIRLVTDLKTYLHMLRKWTYLLAFLFFNFINYLVSQHLYVNTVGGDDWFTEYMQVINFILISTILLRHFKGSGFHS